MEVLWFSIVFTRACHKLKGSTYLTYKLSDLTKWCKTTWEAIGCYIWPSHSGTDEYSSSEMWNCVTSHVVTHVLKALQSRTWGNHMPNHTTSHYSRFEANEVNIFSTACTKEAHLKLTLLSIHIKWLQINNMLCHIYGKFLDFCWNK